MSRALERNPRTVCCRNLLAVGRRWCVFAQQPVQAVGERFAITRTERRRSASDHAAAAQLVHEIAHGQAFANGIARIQFAARIQRVRSLVDGRGGQRNVGSDDQIVRFEHAGDVFVGNVETRCHLREANVPGRRNPHGLIRHQNRLNPGALRGAKQDFLDDARTGIRIHPHFHIAGSVLMSRTPLRVCLPSHRGALATRIVRFVR